MSDFIAIIRPTVMPVVRDITDWSGSSLSAQVAALFASGMKGAWYERSNSATLYQENTGITPTTSAGQTIGLGLSKEQGGGRGTEVITNTNFSNGGTGWSVTGADATHIVTFANNQMRYQSDTTSPNLFAINGPSLVAGKTYEVTVNTVAVANTGGIKSDQFANVVFGAAVGVAVYKIVCGAGNPFSIYRNATNIDVTFSSISIKLLDGNHQRQATASLRPLYQITPQRAVFDGVDDVLNTTFSAALGTNCTVGWAIPGTGAVISTAQNIGTAYADNVTACALVILDGPLTTAQTASLTAYLNQQSVT